MPHFFLCKLINFKLKVKSECVGVSSKQPRAGPEPESV